MAEQLTMPFAEETRQVQMDNCQNCGESFPSDELENTSEGQVCQDCLDEHFRPCERCDELVHLGNQTLVRVDHSYYPYYAEEHWCAYCTSRYASECYQCDNEVSGDYLLSGNIFLCRSCYENSYCTCEECGDFVHYDYSYSNDYGTYCEGCFPKHDTIKGYDYRFDNLRFHNGKRNQEKLYLGVELEIECGNASPNDIGQELVETFDESEYLFCLKEDGSLNNGFEIVSQPCDLAYHKTEFGWKDIIEFLKNQGCTSHNPGTCGLHIHLSKNAISEPTQVKLTHFVNSQVELMETLARRSSNSYAKTIKTKLKRGQNKNDIDRYEAVNFRNHDTIELRLFRGTLRYETFVATLELAHALVEFAQYTSAMVMRKHHKAKQEFLKFVQDRKKRYSNLVEYFKHKGVI